MHIHKFGHCCLLIEENGVRILTDPGSFTTAQNDVKDIDAVLITHEHYDHFHLDSLKAILKNNPHAKVITNSAVGALLMKEGISFTLICDHQKSVVSSHLPIVNGQMLNVSISIAGFGKTHAPIYTGISSVENTGFFIADQLWYPGDALDIFPEQKVEILALPVAGPWMKTAEAMDYVLHIKPAKVFPVHDGFLSEGGPFHRLPAKILGEKKIPFAAILKGNVEW